MLLPNGRADGNADSDRPADGYDDTRPDTDEAHSSPSYGAPGAADDSAQDSSDHPAVPASNWVSGQPGGGCDDPRKIHPHWCGFCGAELLFSATQCQRLVMVPPCDRCGKKEWRSEIDGLTLLANPEGG